MTDLILVLTTMPDDARAEALARALVEEKLAACVSMTAPMTSTYRWQGAVEQTRERQLIIKTSAAHLERLEARLKALHPYELPEFVVLRGEASDDYGGWVRAETVARDDG